MNIVEFLAPMARAKEYLDPGSGSILIQLLVAAALGAAFAVKVYWKKIKGLFGKKETPTDDSPQMVETNEDPPEKK
jgi:hypothetical protein